MPEQQNDIISPDDLRYSQADPVLYTSNNLEKVITGSGLDTGSDGDVNTISSSGEVVALIENYPDESGPFPHPGALYSVHIEFLAGNQLYEL